MAAASLDFLKCIGAEDKITGPSSWDGYAAAVTADACVESQKSGKIVEIKLGSRPGLYRHVAPSNI